MDDAVYSTIIFVGIFLGIVGFCVVRCIVLRHQLHKNDDGDAFTALSSPRDNDDPRRAIARRVEVAARRAARSLCVICGASLKKKGKVSGVLSRPTGINAHQLRVRNRREWMRGVNTAGDTEWVHHLHQEDDIFPAYVLQMKQCDIDGIDTVTISVDIPETEAELSLFAAANTLQQGLDAVSLEVTSALEADALCIIHASASLGSSSLPQLRDIVTSAWGDFPSKFAQFTTSTARRFLAMYDSHAASRDCIHRSMILFDSIEAIVSMTPQKAAAAIRVEFVGEQGIDAGGVYREWCMVLYQQIITPNAGVFLCVDSQHQSFYLNPHLRELLGDAHLAYFLAVGRLLGRALMEGNVTGVHLALPLLKTVLGLPVGFQDRQYFDPETHKNLQWLLENEGVDALALDFTVTETLPSGKTRIVELVPGGEVDVTDANKCEFVDRKLKYLLFESVHYQLYAFVKGVYEVVPAESLLLFDAEELDYVLSGSDEIDVDDWQSNTDVSPNLLDHPALPNFWKIVKELPTAERRSLLQFATGTTRVPPGGFSALTSNDGRQCRFTLQGIGLWRSKGCFRRHSCFNRLDVSMYLELDKLRNALLATTSDDSVGFTIE